MSAYRLTREPRKDLVSIWAFIGADNEGAAEHFVGSLVETFETLAQHPRMGRSREDLCRHCRSFVVGPYVIVYRVGTAGVRILRAVQGMQDLPRLFPA